MTAAAARRKGWRGLGTLLLLAAALTLGAVLRFTGQDWDAGRYLHPDERFFAQVQSAVDPPAGLGDYLDTAHSPLNPNNRGHGFYVYGDLPLVVVQLLGTWLAAPGNDVDVRLLGVPLGTDYAVVYRLGRAVSALCDLLAVLLLFAVGARLYGRGAGLLAAALYAGAALPIQQAHYFTVDAMANLFVVASLWLAARAATEARWTDDVLFGLALGAGLACKLSVFPIAALLGIGVVLRLAAQGQRLRAAALAAPARRSQLAQIAVRAAISFNVAGLTALLAFRLLQPYAFAPPYSGPSSLAPSANVLRTTLNVLAPRLNPRWLDQMERARRQQIGDDDSPPNHQWATRTPFVFPWRNVVQFGLGWPLGVVAWLGWAWALVEGLRGRAESWRHVLPVAWIGLYFAWFGAGWVLTTRYFLPLVPALCLTAAWALVRCAAPQLDAARPGAARPSAWRRRLGAVAIAAVLLSTWAWGFAYTRIYTRPHTRIAASRWLYTHLAPKLALAIDGDGGAWQQPVGLPVTPPAQEPDRDAPEPPVTIVRPDAPLTARFRVARGGHLTAVRLADVRGLAGAPPPALAIALRPLDAPPAVPVGCAPNDAGGAACAFDRLPLDAGREYELRITAAAPARLAGTAIANEGSWDDALPLPLPEIDPSAAGFASYAMEIAWEDDALKRRRLRHVLDRVDYLVISSNRFTGSLPRNPRRWPMTVDYYRALFSGGLGFELVQEFTSPPALGAWTFDDQDAEEALTVYDHPRVLIFRKTAAYDSERTAAILGRAELTAVMRQRAVDVIDTPADLSDHDDTATPRHDAARP